MHRLAASVLAASLLAGCAAIEPSTMARLATMDPLSADPGEIELVAILPDGLAISPDSARLKLEALRGDERRSGTFALAARPADPGIAVPAGSTARGFSLTDKDAQAMRALQADIREWKRQGEAKGSLGLSLDGCATGSGPAPDAVGSVLIQLTEDGPFLPLIRSGKLTDLLGAQAIAAIQPCKGAE